MRSKVWTGVGAGLVAAVIGTGVAVAVKEPPAAAGSSSTEASALRDPLAFARGVDYMGKAFETIDGSSLDWELREALPNVRYSIGGRPPIAVSDAVVVGTVTSTRPGPGIVEVVGEQGVPQTQVAFDSPKAAWSVMYLTVKVERQIGSTAEVPDTIDVEVVLGSPPSNAVMLKALAGQRVLALLKPPGTDPHVSPTAYTIGRGGMGLGFVADDGTLSMPYLGEGEGQYLGALTTVDAVVAEAKKPARVIDTDDFGLRKDRSTYPSWGPRQ